MAKVLREFIGLHYDAKQIKEARLANESIILSGVLQRADAKNQNGRIYPRSILEREVDNYKKAVAEGRAVGECVPPGTEIFTSVGWKNIEDINIGDEIYTLNKQTQKIEIQPVLETVKKPYKDDLIRIYNCGSVDMTLTKKHKVVLWNKGNELKELTAEDLFQRLTKRDSLVRDWRVKRSGVWAGKSDEFFQIPETETKIPIKIWAAFLGIFIAEGHTAGSCGGNSKTYAVGITQVKEESRKLISDILKQMPFEFKEYNSRQFIAFNKDLHTHLKILGNSKTKHIPAYAKEWSPENLQVLLDWMLIGDGKNRKGRNGEIMPEYCTISPQLADDTWEVMFKLGNGALKSIRIPEDRMIEGRLISASNSQPLFTIHQCTKNGVNMDYSCIKQETIPFDGDVFCVRVENGTWLMRQHNAVAWTSNCDHPDKSVVELKNVSHVIREIGWNNSDVVGKVEILNTPSGQILKSLMESGIKLGISSRGVGEVQKDDEGNDVVDESFVLICFDVVSEPSTHGAWLGESKNVDIKDVYSKLSKRDRVNRIVNEILRG